MFISQDVADEVNPGKKASPTVETEKSEGRDGGSGFPHLVFFLACLRSCVDGAAPGRSVCSNVSHVSVFIEKSPRETLRLSL